VKNKVRGSFMKNMVRGLFVKNMVRGLFVKNRMGVYFGILTKHVARTDRIFESVARDRKLSMGLISILRVECV
jgi:hypothetical protein